MRTLNDITPPSRRREMESITNPPAGNAPLRLTERPRFPFATLIAIVLVIGASIGALFYFSSAKVDVIPNTVSAAVQSSFTATQSGGVLPYEIITAQKIATQSVKGSGTKAVNSSASGTITIYNTQSKAQPLVANTRFATAAGLIFRIHSSVTVPGGSATKPGSVSAKVFADQAGSSYNVGATSFTIPGFSGTPQATEVYARSTSSMTGGASGNIPTVDTALETSTRNALTTALKPDLTASLASQVPEGYTLVTGSATTTFDDMTPAPSATTGMVDVKEQGTMTAIVFPNASLAKAIATSVSGLEYQGEPVTLSPASNLVLVPTSAIDASVTTFSFTLSGTAALVYTVDPTRIAAAIAGKTRSAAEVALTNYPEVKRAVIVLRPFWRQSFPQDPSKISVVIETP